MSMQTPKDLFIHEMSDIYDAEQRILKMLSLMAQETQNADVKQALETHENETKQQITNIEQCFTLLGTSPEKSAACLAIEGLKKEHDAFLKENPTPELLMMFNLGGADKTEHYEIASYKGLIEKANLMGQKECVQLLQQNLKQEENMAKRVESMSLQFGKQMAAQMK